MKKTLFIVLFIAAGMVSASAQQLEKGQSLLNIGAGFGPGIGVNVSYDYALIDHWGPGMFTVGAFGGFNTWNPSNYKYGGVSYKYREYNWAIAPRATYRYSFDFPLEVYASVMTGVMIYTYHWDNSSITPEDNSVGIFVGGTVGARYSFSDSFSVFSELGYNTAVFTVGVSFKL